MTVGDCGDPGLIAGALRFPLSLPGTGDAAADALVDTMVTAGKGGPNSRADQPEC